MRAIQSIKDLMERDQMSLAEANQLLTQRIAERNRATNMSTGTNDTKVLITALSRLYEAGVE